MFNSGNNKGPMSWVGSAPRVVHQHHVEVVDRTVNGKNVDYWYGYAMNMEKRATEMEKRATKLTESEDHFMKVAIERRANNSGLWAVIHYLIAALAKASPNHILNNKENRSHIFEKARKEELVRALKVFEMQMWSPLKRPDEKETL